MILLSTTVPRALSPAASVGEKLAELAKRQVDIAFISSLPPGALVPARYLYKRMRSAHPDLEIIVGLWSQGISAAELQERIGADAKLNFATTLAEARDQVGQLAPVLALRKKVLIPAR